MWFVLVVNLIFSSPTGIVIKQTQKEYRNEESCEKSRDWIIKHYPNATATCRQQV